MKVRILFPGFLRALLITFTAIFPETASWHGFDNTDYHCWDLTASASNTVPITCDGFNLRWIALPDETIKAQTAFNITFELKVNDGFYTWAYDNSYFSAIPSVTSASEAKTWCVTTVCPVAMLANQTNCCVWHVNVHSCPLSETIYGLCGPWILPSGGTFTHSEVLVGPVSTGNWTCYVSGLYQLGITSLIAHFRIAGMQIALETKVNVVPKAECGDGKCEDLEGENCDVCPADCGTCPLEAWQLALIGVGVALVLGAAIGVLIYFQYQKRKLFWDESWIIPYENIKQDDGLRGALGSMISSGSGLGASDGSNSIAASATRRQIFAKTAIFDGRTCVMRRIKKKEFHLSQDIRREVKEVRETDHTNLCKFVGGSIEVPNVCILMEYCPKGSLSDVLLNDDVPLNWAFRFSFAADISRGMQYLHSHKLYHGRLTSNNSVVDERWAVKITDYGLCNFRKNDEMLVDVETYDEDESYYHEKRNQVYKAPEFLNNSTSDPTACGDVYAFSIILIEIATRNDPYGDDDAFSVPPGWKPPIPLLDEMTESKDDICPCPSDYAQLIQDCWQPNPEHRPSFDLIKKTIHKINPSKLSPVDLMMAMMEKYSKHLESIVAERTQDLEAEKAKTDRLLHSMLPKSVADELRIGRPVNAEIHDACTIYFSDIVGFTTISGASTPMQVVALLNKLYITFDEIIDKYDVYKVETIGDAYMVVSGIPVATPFHAREIANMAIDLVKACTDFKIPHMPDEPLKIRVGLHSGSACAGVVGLKMPRYCLFGDTVNTASRMESNGEAYRIHISNFTYLELVKIGGYMIEKRGLIPVKGKGEMLTWWLIDRYPDYELKQSQKNAENVEQKNTIYSSDKLVLAEACEDILNDPMFINPTDNLTNKSSSKTNTVLGQSGTILKTKEARFSDNLDYKEIREDQLENEFAFTPVELPANLVQQKNILILCQQILTPAPKLLNLPTKGCDSSTTAIDSPAKVRKISNISSSNDSGYNDKGEERSLQEITVRSCESLHDIDDTNKGNKNKDLD